MAISAATVWEVRPTIGADTNGGAFVAGAAGTDYSQQDAKNTVGNNISTTDAVANGTTTLTSATAAFTAAIVGNVIYLAGGSGSLAAGWYQVVTFTNSTTIVLDRTVASGTGITLNIGGALATPQPAVTQTASVGGMTVYIQARASLVLTATLGTLNSTLTVIGYTTTRGDNGQATVTTATNSVPLWTIGNFGLYCFQNLKLTNTAATRAPAFAPTNAFFSVVLELVNCLVDGCTTVTNLGSAGGVVCNPLILDACEVRNCTGSGIDWQFTNALNLHLLGCYFHNNGGMGVRSSSQNGQYHFERSVFNANTSHGIILGGSGGGPSNLFMINCASLGNGGDGLRWADGNATVLAWNNVLESNTGWGINSTVATIIGNFRNNAFRANTSGAHTGITTTGDITLTAEPFTNPGAGDFTLNNDAGGGAACRGAGYPSTLP